MASALLNCSICPKHPTFSDTSHLLTHVSSKGHLSHLHKLQVRSHQEFSAGAQLAAYDQWYQQHGLGRLLSERMLQKEAKRSSKRRRATHATRKIKKEYPNGTGIAGSGSIVLAIDPGLHQTPATRGTARHSLDGDNDVQFDYDSDYCSSPIKNYSRRKSRRSVPSPIKRSASDLELNGSDVDCPAEVDPEILGTPDNSKLKGVLWPGMDLFDAATAEMRRRRNQKKDGSALVQLEKTSKIVQPTEVIYSNGWTSIKQRPITGMVEDTSPIKGESPLPKKPVRRKRSPLKELNANVTRNVGRPVKVKHSQATGHRHGPEEVRSRPLPSLPSSSADTPYAVKSRFSPTEDENLEFKLTVGQLANQKKGGNFTIFHDEDTKRRIPKMVSQAIETTHPQFALPQMQAQVAHPRSHMPFMTTPWLQPQYQQTLPYQSLYMTQGREQPAHYTHQHVGFGKEKVEPWFGGIGETEQHANPLGWNQNAMLVQNPYRTHNDFGFDGPTGFSSLSSHDDVFGYSANPLSAAYEHLQEHLESPFKTSETSQIPTQSRNEKNVSVSPDGTISEPTLHGYGPNVLTTRA